MSSWQDGRPGIKADQVRAGLARRALVLLVRRVCQGAFVVAAHAGACALRRRRGASAGARAPLRVRAVLTLVER